MLALREFAAKQRWAIVNEYIDQQSAKDDDREQFQQLFKDASQRRFDVLLFWSLDRLSREGVLETLQHLQRLTSYGIAWRVSDWLSALGLAWSVSGARVSAWDGPVAKVDAAAIRALREQDQSWSEISRRTGLARQRFSGLAAKLAATATAG